MFLFGNESKQLFPCFIYKSACANTHVHLHDQLLQLLFKLIFTLICKSLIKFRVFFLCFIGEYTNFSYHLELQLLNSSYHLELQLLKPTYTSGNFYSLFYFDWKIICSDFEMIKFNEIWQCKRRQYIKAEWWCFNYSKMHWSLWWILMYQRIMMNTNIIEKYLREIMDNSKRK